LVFSVLEDEHFNDFFLQQLCLLLKNLPMAIWENVQSRLIDLMKSSTTYLVVFRCSHWHIPLN